MDTVSKVGYQPSWIYDQLRPERASLYVHIPFCSRACSYCAFAIVVNQEHLAGRYIDTVVGEISARSEGLGTFDTVYFGGGTPSRIDPKFLERILRFVEISDDAEVTVEVNPEDVNSSYLAFLADIGVNRISLGIQSLDDQVLSSFRRLHRSSDALAALEIASESPIAEISVDLIFGDRAETSASWSHTVGGVLRRDFRVDHLSAYALTVEERTMLHHRRDQYPHEDILADRYIEVEAMATDVGLLNYEISSWARSGHHSRHNVRYWLHEDYLGVGNGAHSLVGRRRSWNPRSLQRYLDTAGYKYSQEGWEDLDDSMVQRERLMFGLRSCLGVSVGEVDLPEELKSYFEISDSRLRLNLSGRLIGDAIIARLM